MTVPFGCNMDAGLLTGPVARRQMLARRVVDAGIRHTFTADHVSFHTGLGMDGLVRAALVSALHDELAVHIGVYLLALRHPLPVARQIATLAEAAPGRLVLGIGVGGEDRHEFEICGIDPKTRGRRTSEALSVLRPLLAGAPVTHHGEFYDFDAALIRPAPNPAVPIVVGGRSPAALARAARYGDGWLAVWVDAARYRQTLAQFHEHADRCGRGAVPWSHGIQLWMAVDADRAVARARLAQRMEAMYRIPYARFEKYAPAGSAAEIAAFLAPMIESGCSYFNVQAIADSPEQAIDDLAAVRAALKN